MKLGRYLPWLGVAAALLLLVNVNVLGARWYQRWDVTSDKLYTLSQPTLELLRGLQEPVDVNVLLSKSDPLSVSVHHMLEAYGAETTQLRTRYVDPDRSPAEFLALQQKYQILAGKAEDGRVVTDAAIVVARGERHWFITAEELVRLDESSGRAQPALEQALSSALANLRRDEKAKLCFAVGQRQPTVDDRGPQGLSELSQRLLKNNYEVVSVELAAPTASLADCVALAVIAPELELPAQATRRVADYLSAGGSALFVLPPTLGEDRRVLPSGLEPVLEPLGVSLGRDVVLEQDGSVRLPSGQGELFFATVRAHPTTRGILHDDDKLSSRVLVVQSRSLRVTGDAKLVLESSEQGLAVDDVAALADPAGRAELAGRLTAGRLGLAAARELPAKDGRRASRVFVTGAGNLAHNRNFQDPSLYGNRRLLENAISWLAARPSMISVPQKPEREVGLSLSEESLGEVMRYVLLYMPVSAALIGAFVLLRRRSVERESRREGSAPRGDAKG